MSPWQTPPRLAVVLLGSLAVLGCRPETQAHTPHKSASWLTGDPDEQLSQVARHLRGFDVAMVETGYRYQELYWAAQDGNWPYAAYQIEHIEKAVALAAERRPKRAESSKMLDPALQQVSRAVEAREAQSFASAFDHLTSTCNACHAAEGVPFMHVKPPTQRLSPIGTPPR